MTQQLTRARGGWREDEAKALFERVSQAEKEGKPLRAVFEEVGRELGRKPNSIRNFYYAKVHESPELSSARKPAFRVFSQDETHKLVSAVLIARGRGDSVRACVRELAKGDPKQMLRYQNKYRSVMKSKPDMLEQIAKELLTQGVSVPPMNKLKPPQHRHEALEKAAQQYAKQAGDKAANTLLEAITLVMELAARQDDSTLTGDLTSALEKSQEQASRARVECDRLRVQVDLQKMIIEDLQKQAAMAYGQGGLTQPAE